MPTKPQYITMGGEEYDVSDMTLPIHENLIDAWEIVDSDAPITVNMTVAKDLWRNTIRQFRDLEWATIDASFMRALETGASTDSIVAEKQALRDLPSHPDIEAAATPEELIAFLPTQRMIDEFNQ